MKRASRRVRTARACALVAVGALPLLAGCAVFSPASTGTNYQPADGVSATVGTVLARDLVVVGTSGSEGLVSGALVNTGDSAQTVTISTKDAPQPVQVQVPAGALVTLGGAGSGASVSVGTLSTAAGALLAVTVATPGGGSVVTSVPVLPPTNEYATITPTPN